MRVLDEKLHNLEAIMLAQNPELAESGEIPSGLVPAEEQTSLAGLVNYQAQIIETGEVPRVTFESQINNEQVILEVGLEGVLIRHDDGTVENLSLAQYVALKVAEDKNYRFFNDPVYQALAGQVAALRGQVTQAVANFNQAVDHSSSLVLAAKLELQAGQIALQIENINKELKEKLGNRELSELSPEELQEHYGKLYREIFNPARIKLSQILTQRREILARMRNTLYQA